MNIKVGDKIKLKNSPHLERDVLYIHQKPGDGRKFYVVAYMGDIPTSHQEHELTKAPEVVEKVYYLDGEWIYYMSECHSTHKVIITHVNNEPVSVRLEKL